MQLRLGYLEKARADLQRAVQLAPANAEARAELLACNARLAEYRERRKQLSKRMLAGAWARKGAPVRCKSCISEAERAEAAQAAVNAANKAAIKAADGEIKQERCAGCSKMLAPSAFSRSQLLQKGEAKRCRACVGAAGASVGSSLLSEAVAAPRGAKLSVLRASPATLRMAKAGDARFEMAVNATMWSLLR